MSSSDNASDLSQRLPETTKHVIVQTALHMFAQHGIDGVSLSELRTASGQNNRSAIHYHFGNKEGLLDAVTDYLGELLEEGMEASVAEARHLQKTGQLDIPAFVRLLGRPFMALYRQGELGRDCIRLLSHLGHEMNDRQHERAFAPMQDYLGDMAGLLQTLMPGKTRQELAPLMFLTNCSLLESLICSPMLTRPHSLGGESIKGPDLDQLMELSLSFACGGLLAASQRSGVSSN